MYLFSFASKGPKEGIQDPLEKQGGTTYTVLRISFLNDFERVLLIKNLGIPLALYYESLTICHLGERLSC